MTQGEQGKPSAGELERRRFVRRSADEDMHNQHHAFIAIWIEKEKRKQELWEKIKAQVLGWGLVALLAWLAVVCWEAIVHLIRVK